MQNTYQIVRVAKRYNSTKLSVTKDYYAQNLTKEEATARCKRANAYMMLEPGEYFSEFKVRKMR